MLNKISVNLPSSSINSKQNNIENKLPSDTSHKKTIGYAIGTLAALGIASVGIAYAVKRGKKIKPTEMPIVDELTSIKNKITEEIKEFAATGKKMADEITKAVKKELPSVEKDIEPAYKRARGTIDDAQKAFKELKSGKEIDTLVENKGADVSKIINYEKGAEKFNIQEFFEGTKDLKREIHYSADIGEQMQTIKIKEYDSKTKKLVNHLEMIYDNDNKELTPMIINTFTPGGSPIYATGKLPNPVTIGEKLGETKTLKRGGLDANAVDSQGRITSPNLIKYDENGKAVLYIGHDEAKNTAFLLKDDVPVAFAQFSPARQDIPAVVVGDLEQGYFVIKQNSATGKITGISKRTGDDFTNFESDSNFVNTFKNKEFNFIASNNPNTSIRVEGFIRKDGKDFTIGNIESPV